MSGARARWTLLAAALMVGVLALWWRYGEAIVLAQPSWLCLPR